MKEPFSYSREYEFVYCLCWVFVTLKERDKHKHMNNISEFCIFISLEWRNSLGSMNINTSITQNNKMSNIKMNACMNMGWIEVCYDIIVTKTLKQIPFFFCWLHIEMGTIYYVQILERKILLATWNRFGDKVDNKEWTLNIEQL